MARYEIPRGPGAGAVMDSKSVLKGALTVVRQTLKARGFAAKGTRFHRRTESGNTEILSFQKSVKSTSSEVLLTINYGVYSACVGTKLGDDPSASLHVEEAHWRKRLRESGREKWLLVKATDSVNECAKAILSALDGVLLELHAHAENEQLRDTWLAGQSPGIGRMQRLLFLAILVKQLGPADRLRDVVAELRQLVSGSVHAGLVDRQLKMAGIQGQ